MQKILLGNALKKTGLKIPRDTPIQAKIIDTPPKEKATGYPNDSRANATVNMSGPNPLYAWIMDFNEQGYN